MTERGVDFLEQWIEHFLKIWIQENVLPRSDERNQPLELAKKLIADAKANGFSVDDLEIKNNDLAGYIQLVIVQIQKPGTTEGEA